MASVQFVLCFSSLQIDGNGTVWEFLMFCIFFLNFFKRSTVFCPDDEYMKLNVGRQTTRHFHCYIGRYYCTMLNYWTEYLHQRDTHLSCAHIWYFGCMLWGVPAGVILLKGSKKGGYGWLGVLGDISWLRNICICRSYICLCFSSASARSRSNICYHG